VRDALTGMRRFDQFQESLGIAPNILTDRINRLLTPELFPDEVVYAAFGTLSAASHSGQRSRGRAARPVAAREV